MSQWDLNNADTGGEGGIEQSGHSGNLEAKRKKSQWEKRMEAARAQRARVLSGEIPATPRPLPPARELAKGDGVERNPDVAARPPEGSVVPAPKLLSVVASARVIFDKRMENARRAAATVRTHPSWVYELLTSRLAFVSIMASQDLMKHKKAIGTIVACGCCLVLGYVIGSRSDGADALQPHAIVSVTETPLPTSEEARGPIIVGRLAEPEPDVMTFEVSSQAQTRTAQKTAMLDASEIPPEHVAVWPVGLAEAEPVAPEMPDILSDLANIAWTSKIIVQPETVPDVRSVVVSLPPAAPEVPPGSGPDEVVRLAGLPAQVENLRMLVFAPDSVRSSVLQENLTRLTSSGAEIAGLQRVGMRISTAHIRYFFEEDAKAAMDLGDTLGIEARNFLHMSGSEPGQVEVWLRGASLAETADPDAEPDGPRSFRDRFSGDYR